MNWVLQSVFLGVILSFSTGTTFISLLNLSLRRGFRHGISFAFGVFVSDLLFVGLLFYGVSDFYLQNHFQKPFSIIGGVAIIICGIRLLIKPERKINIEIESEKGLALKSVLQGFLINIFNPLAFVFWLAVMTMTPIEIGFLGVFFVLITMLVTDCIKAILIDKWRYRIKENLFKNLNYAMATLLIIIGIKLIWSA